MTKSEELFNSLKERYEQAYLKSNGRPLAGLSYKKGYVHIKSDLSFSPDKYRMSTFQEMLNTLEARVTQSKD